jgi:hypothetical protein
MVMGVTAAPNSTSAPTPTPPTGDNTTTYILVVGLVVVIAAALCYKFGPELRRRKNGEADPSKEGLLEEGGGAETGLNSIPEDQPTVDMDAPPVRREQMEPGTVYQTRDISKYEIGQDFRGAGAPHAPHTLSAHAVRIAERVV